MAPKFSWIRRSIGATASPASSPGWAIGRAPKSASVTSELRPKVTTASAPAASSRCGIERPPPPTAPLDCHPRHFPSGRLLLSRLARLAAPSYPRRPPRLIHQCLRYGRRPSTLKQSNYPPNESPQPAIFSPDCAAPLSCSPPFVTARCFLSRYSDSFSRLRPPRSTYRLAAFW